MNSSATATQTAMQTATPAAKSPRLQGPRHLLEWLLSTEPLNGLHLLGLDSERQVWSQHFWPLLDSLSSSRSCVPPVDWPARDEMAAWVVVALTSSHESAARLRAELGAKAEIAALQPLDVLVYAEDRWWSAICQDIGCCPASGREVIRAAQSSNGLDEEDIKLALRSLGSFLASTSETTASDSTAMALQSLADVKTRDALLVALLDKSIRESWIRKFESARRILQSTQKSAAMASALCIQSTAHSLNSEHALARTYADEALGLDPNYSYAKLLDQALQTTAPTSLVISALESSRLECSSLVDIIKQAANS